MPGSIGRTLTLNERGTSMRKIIVAVSIAGLGLLTPLAASAQTTTTLVTPANMDLHPTKVMPKARGVVTVTLASAGKFTVHIDARGLPKPTTLKSNNVRRTYLAWFINGTDMKNMGVLTLKAGPKAGDYFADGTVNLPAVTEVMITADLKPAQPMPTMPQITLLQTGMM